MFNTARVLTAIAAIYGIYLVKIHNMSIPSQIVVFTLLFAIVLFEFGISRKA